LLSYVESYTDNDNNRYTFNTFGRALITTFVLFTAEGWNTIMVYYIHKFGWAVVMYFVSLIVFGNIMLLNLFLAILLNFIAENLDDDNNAP
jgi:hypothetical protein